MYIILYKEDVKFFRNFKDLVSVYIIIMDNNLELDIVILIGNVYMDINVVVVLMGV